MIAVVIFGEGIIVVSKVTAEDCLVGGDVPGVGVVFTEARITTFYGDTIEKPECGFSVTGCESSSPVGGVSTLCDTDLDRLRRGICIGQGILKIIVGIRPGRTVIGPDASAST